MFKSGSLWKALVLVVLAGALVVGGVTVGYWLGRWSAPEQQGEAAPGTPPGFFRYHPRLHPGWHWGFMPFLWGVKALFRVALLALVLAALIRLFGILAWRMAGRPMRSHWAASKGCSHWHGPHGPWCWETPPEEKAEPEAEGQEARPQR